MGRRTAAVTDYQQRAREFQVGDLVYPFLSGNRDLMGRVVGVYPAIGMVQVQRPHGSERMPVEDLQRFESDEYKPPEVENDTVPGGRHTVPVSSGTGRTASVNRVAEAYAKKALYWGAVDRKYRATSGECNDGQFRCPRCQDQYLTKAIYRRQDGQSDHLLGCKQCLFLVRREDVIGHPDYENSEFEDAEPRMSGKKGK